MDEKSPYIIGLSSDHAGYELKERIKGQLIEKDTKYKDFGAYSEGSVDYPDFGKLLGEAIVNKKIKYGIAICGSGIGISIALNRITGVRAALCYNNDMARLARQHNDANVIVFGARFISYKTAINLLDIFDKDQFEGGRHIPRINKLG